MVKRIIRAFKSLKGGRDARRYARVESAALLGLVEHVRASEPEMRGRALYERVVARRLGCDEREARTAVLRAEQDFAQWPVQRDVTLRDVVSHLVVRHITANGYVADVASISSIVEKIVPGEV